MNTELYIKKYQPKYFSDFEENNDIIKTLKILINMNEFNVLLVGNNSTGKTTYLNLIINEYYYNIENYNENVLCINNLKEQGINYYRNEVKNFCKTCCTIPNKKKIIIIDDIDLINDQSQHVFRNCIDKYKNNINFIASCSNIKKVIESLQSRLLILKINYLKKENLKMIMDLIMKNENIPIDNDAQEFILTICNNNVKILLNYMEKFKLLNLQITLDIANQLCSNISFLMFDEYTKQILLKNTEKAIILIYDIYKKGFSIADILDNYFNYIKITNILNEDEKYKIIEIICKYISVIYNIHEDEIELALFTNNLCNI